MFVRRDYLLSNSNQSSGVYLLPTNSRRLQDLTMNTIGIPRRDYRYELINVEGRGELPPTPQEQGHSGHKQLLSSRAAVLEKSRNSSCGETANAAAVLRPNKQGDGYAGQAHIHMSMLTCRLLST